MPRPAVTHLALAIGFIILAACAGDRPEHRDGSDGGDNAPRYGGTLVIAGPSDLGSMNGLLAADTWTQEVLQFALFLPLLRYDPGFDYGPLLAERWEMIGDTGVVFHLRRDVYWQDGPQTTAHDVAFTYERARNPATNSTVAHYFERWGAVEVLDSFTIRFRFEPHSDPLASWPSTPIMPRHRLESVPPEAMRQAAFNRSPIGNGPFRFVSYQPNDRWIFEANPEFPAALGGRPYIDRVVWRVVPDNTAQATELITGTADLILGPRAEQLRELDARPGIRAIQRPTRNYVFIGWNGAHPWFRDARVRRALSMAIDRKRLIDSRAGYGQAAAGPISPNHWAYDPEIRPLPYDTAAARALLAEAGFEDRDGDGALEDAAGADVEFTLKTTAGNTFQRNMAELIRADLAAIGARVNARAVEWGTLISDIANAPRNFDAVIMAWSADIRINLTPMFHSSALGGQFQLASYSNPEFDRLVNEASRLVDREAAMPLWRRIQEIMRDEQPWTFLYYAPDLYAVRERVQSVNMDGRGVLLGLPRWWLADAAGTRMVTDSARP